MERAIVLVGGTEMHIVATTDMPASETPIGTVTVMGAGRYIASYGVSVDSIRDTMITGIKHVMQDVNTYMSRKGVTHTASDNTIQWYQ